ncbi:TPA: hypothetical protein ACXE2W_002188 [Serratia marcescens]
MTQIMTFSSTTARRIADSGFRSHVLDVVASVISNGDLAGTGAITGFVTSQQVRGFNFDLAKMTSRVECEEVLMPADLHSVEALDAWLMGLNLE